MDKADRIQSVIDVIANYRAGLSMAETTVADPQVAASITDALTLLHEMTGRLIVAGMGKSGLIGRKLAATFASTGTPAYFVHPAEASHGDLGMIRSDDVLLMLSWSGETRELSDMLGYAQRFGVPTICLTGAPQGALARRADVAIVLPKVDEACPHNLAPTTSTLLQLAIGDALAVTLLKMNGFTPDGFRKFHPGGKLGSALTPVREVMHRGQALPLVGAEDPVFAALTEISAKGLGIVGIKAADDTLAGVITDGDIRRYLETNAHGRMDDVIHGRKAHDLMTQSHISLGPDGMAAAALNTLQTNRISAAFVLEAQKPVGLVTVLQLLQLGVA